jgi:hypothetical protein
MPKSKQTAADKRGSRTKRNPRDPSPEREESSTREPSSLEPLDDLYGDSDGAVDSEMEFDTGKYERPIPDKPSAR